MRRPEVLALFEQHVYGRTPGGFGQPAFDVLATRSDALGGRATRRLVRVTLPRVPDWPGLVLMLHVPNGPGGQPAGRVPCFVGLNFAGNHSATNAADVPIVADSEVARGAKASRWPFDQILGRGVAVATAWYGDIEPDSPNGWRRGLRGAAAPQRHEHDWQPGEWGAIGAWAFGLRLMADYLEQDPAIDPRRLAVIGHSRLGKTALWAGAQDSRFTVVVSNDSGEGGAALMRRPVGETTAKITSTFPHWFTSTYATYGDDPSRCPVDQHMLVGLAAPRAVYIGSAIEDSWADPEGEFLAGLLAGPVYEAFGLHGVGVERWPAVDVPVGHHVGYHVRRGGHDLTAYDWQRYVDFAWRHWRDAAAD